MRVVLVGGGTGGHFYPLIAIAEALVDTRVSSGLHPDLYYMGPNPYDADALLKLGIRFIQCPAGKQRRYASFLNFVDVFKIAFGLVVAACKLFWIYPDVIISKGGYTSVPVIFAASFLRIPIIVHESDSVVGRANAYGAKHARYVAVSYAETASLFPKEKVALTGVPIRHVLLSEPVEDPRKLLALQGDIPLILILGGSQGAERVNDLVLEALDELLPAFHVIHQTGTAHFDSVRTTATTLIKDEILLSRYHPAAFLTPDVLNLAYYAAAIVISRSGSGSIFEIGAHAKPSILIPIPEEISHDQRSNAYSYARAGAATVIEEGNLRDGLLMAEISRIMSDRSVYEGMSTAAQNFAPRDAARKIADIALDIISEHR